MVLLTFIFLGILIISIILLIWGWNRYEKLMFWSKNKTKRRFQNTLIIIAGISLIIMANTYEEAKKNGEFKNLFQKNTTEVAADDEVNVDKDSLNFENFKKDFKNYIAKYQFDNASELIADFPDTSRYYSELDYYRNYLDSVRLTSIKDRLNSQIKDITDGIDYSGMKTSTDMLMVEVGKFSSWWQLIDEAKEFDDKEIQSLASTLKRKVIYEQQKEFPKLRKAYADLLDKKLWEKDIDVSASGKGYKTLNITGYQFAANKNIKDFEDAIYDMINALRFNKVTYKSFKGQSEYQYYHYDDMPNDKDPIKE